jgi:hypothetical protein
MPGIRGGIKEKRPRDRSLRLWREEGNARWHRRLAREGPMFVTARPEVWRLLFPSSFMGETSMSPQNRSGNGERDQEKVGTDRNGVNFAPLRIGRGKSVRLSEKRTGPRESEERIPPEKQGIARVEARFSVDSLLFSGSRSCRSGENRGGTGKKKDLTIFRKLCYGAGMAGQGSLGKGQNPSSGGYQNRMWLRTI